MTVSGILAATTPEHIDEVCRAIGAYPWAQVHFTDGRGRVVLTIEADDEQASVDRLLEIRRIPQVWLAEMVEVRNVTEEMEPS